MKATREPRFRSHIVTIALGMLSLNSAGCGWTEEIPSLDLPENATPVERNNRLDQWFAELQRDNQFNGTVMIAQHGKAILAKGYGFTDYTKKTPLTADSSMRLGSVSKQFTATAIMLLHKSGALTYDDLVSKHIPGFPYPDVTIRHLVNQVSGVPDNYIQLAQSKQDSIPLLTNELATKLVIEANEKAETPPNVEFKYSNTNYILLARIVEIVSRSTFEDFLSNELFKPLGMNNSRVWNLVSATPTFPGKTASIGRDWDEFVELKPTFLDGVSGDGGVFSSANDLLLWDNFWSNELLLTSAEKAVAFAKPVLTNGTSSNYGFGWLVEDNFAIHDGSWLGARTMIVRSAKNRAFIVLLDNSSNALIPDILEELMDADLFQ